MTPFWIVDFLEGDSVESFFKTYWDAYCENNTDSIKPLKFFHVTNGKDAGLTKEQLNEIASQRLSMSSQKEEKLIPAFTRNQGNTINVLFIGDITQSNTINRFHMWAAYLQKQRMSDGPWHSINRVRTYGILLRPASTTINETVLSRQTKGFLNELSSLEGINSNYRPFEQVLFIQAPLDVEGRTAAEYAANLAAYHIARTDGRCLDEYDVKYYDANATGVFYESTVQKEIDAYNLSVIVLKDLTENQDEYFLDVQEARDFVSANQDFIDGMRPLDMKKNFISQCPSIPNLQITKFNKSLSLLNLVSLWQEYNTNHIEQVVHHVNQELKVFETDFRRALNMRQYRYICDRTKILRELVFQLFASQRGMFTFKHVGIQQSLKILEEFKLKISDAFKSLEQHIDAFIMPTDLDMLMKKSTMIHASSNDVLTLLRNQMEYLPKYKRSLAAISSGTGLLVSAILAFFTIWGLCALPLAFLIGGIIYVMKINGLENLKDLYVGLRLQEIRQSLNEQTEKLADKTRSEMLQYIKWLREKRLISLQKEMSVITPPCFHFEVSKALQPLIWTRLQENMKSGALIQSNEISYDIQNSSQTGTFGRYPLTQNTPGSMVCSLVDDSQIGIYDLIKNRKDIVQAHVQALMRTKEWLHSGLSENVGFQRHESGSSNLRMLLLLDVSGSMYADMAALKNYVHELESVGEIEWIAFNHDVAATSDNTEVENLKSDGGTNYIPAIRKAEEWLKTKDFDSIVLLSDGQPFEELKNIITAAEALGMPINTIAVGNAAEQVLIEIAMQTGGKEVTVDSFEDIKTPEVWSSEILQNIEILDNNQYSFGKLMEYVQIEACAKALHTYALQCMGDISLTIPQIFNTYLTKNGFAEWVDVTSQRNTLSLSASLMSDKACFSSTTCDNSERMERTIGTLCDAINVAHSLDFSEGEAEMIVSLLSRRPLVKISDLQWASSMKHGDVSLNDPKMLKELMGNQGQVVNIYDEAINA